MKKTFQIIALLVLLIQNFAAPMVALAETVEPQAVVEPMTLTRIEGKLLNLDKSELASTTPLEDSGQYVLQVKGHFTKEAPTVEELVLSVSSNFGIKIPTFAVAATDQSSLGQGTATGNTLKLAIAETVVTDKEFVLEVPVEYHGTPELTADALTLTSPLGNQEVNFAVFVQEAIDVEPETEVAEEVESAEIPTKKEENVKEKHIDNDTPKKELKAKKSIGGEEIKINIIDSADVTVDENPTTLSSKITFDLKWSFPQELINKVVAGDFYQFKLPKEVKVVENIINYPLEDPNNEGKIVAHVTIDENGFVKFVFTDEVENAEKISGFLKFTTMIDRTMVTSPQDFEIKIPVKSKDKIVTISLESNVDQGIDKSGRPNKSLNPDKIDWDVYVNKPKEKLTGLVVTDTIPAGLTLDEVEVYAVGVDFDGNVTKLLKKLTAGTDYQVDLATGTVTFLGESNDAYRITYKTTIEDKAKGDGGTVKFINEASVKSDTFESIGTSATVTATYGEILVKEAPQYDQAKQTFNWHVKYNYGEKTISAADAYIVDEFSSNLELVKENLVVMKMVANEDGQYAQASPLVEGEDYQLVQEGNKFQIKFIKNVDYAVDVHYETKVKEGTIVADGGVDVKNDIKTKGYTGKGQTGKAQSNGLFKYMDEIDYAQERITWSIYVNQDLYEMTDWSLTDSFPNGGLSFIEDTFKMEELEGKSLETKQDFELIGKAEDGFDLKLIGNYNPTKKAFKITYQTSFDRDKLEPKNALFENLATATWTDKDGKDHTNNASASARPKNETYYNGSKHGMYNAKNKEITWEVVTNFNRNMLKKAQIIDPITGNQQFIPGSAVLESFTVNKAGGLEIVEKTVLSNLVPTEQNGQPTLVVDLPENTDLGYRLTFKTSLKGQVIETSESYTNIATLLDEGVEKDSLTGKVELTHGGELASKTGKVDNPNASKKVSWEILVNYSQSTLEDLVIKDYPSINQVIDGETVVITEVDGGEGNIMVPTKNKLTLGKDYELVLERDDETGAQTMTINFKFKVEKAYIITYDADLVLASTDKKVTNKVVMTASNKQVISKEVTESKEVSHNEISGGGESVRTNFFLKKVSQGKDDKKSPLAGIEIEVINNATKKVVLRKKTNEKGIIAVNGVTTGKYTIKEIGTPTGHFVSEELKNGKEIIVTEESNKEETAIEIINKKSLVEFKKMSEANQALPGAVFELSRKNNTGEYVVDPLYRQLTSNQDGVVSIEGLVAGDYRIREVLAPVGYILNPTPRDFTLTGEETAVVTLPPMVNYQGSASLVKTDGEGNILAGAEFTLTNLKEPNFKRVQTSGLDGKVTFTGLAPGTYSVKETKAPAGYILNNTAQQFEIKDTSDTAQIVPLKTVENYQGTAELTKVTATDSLLSGAEFKVFDSETEQAVTDSLTTAKNGKVRASALAPGNYYFQETKAPVGYILNTEKYPFEIKANADVAPATVNAGKATNYQGSASLTKTDSQNQPLADAIFKVVNEKGEAVQTDLTTGTDGRVVVNNLAPGKYAFIETAAPKGYVINGIPQEFEIVAESKGEPKRVSNNGLVNFKGEAQLIKMDEGNKPLAGATFKVVTQSGELVAENLVSNRDGVVTVSGLVAGEYAFIETKAAPGFMRNETPKTFVIQASYEGKPSLEVAGKLNNYRGSVMLSKKSEAKQPLQAASFKLYTISNDYIGTYLTDVKGEITINQLAPGQYYFEEAEAPTGFVKNTEKINFEIKETATTTPEMVKVDAINYQGSAQLIKKSEDGQALAGATFKVIDEAGETVQSELVSKANGEVLVENLAPGIYYFVETEAAPGHVLNEEKLVFTIANENLGKPQPVTAGEFKNYQGKVQLFKTDAVGNELAKAIFKLVDEKGQTLQENLTTDSSGRIEVNKLAPGTYSFIETQAPVGYMLNDTPATFTIEPASNGQTIFVKAGTVVNYRGSVTLNKTNAAGKVLVDASFTLYDALDKVIKTVTTDKNGQATVKDLKPGDYYFLETEAPSGYLINTAKVSFTISDKATETPVATSVTSINYKGSAELVKVDENGDALAGAIFRVMTEDGKVQVKEGLTSSADGKVVIDNLAPGHYYFEETDAPTGYIKNKTTVPFTISSKADEEPVVVTANDAGKLILANYTGSVEFNKVSETNELLEGAVFKLTKEGDEDFKQEVTSDENGLVRVTGLAPGKYHFEEITPAPGYMKNLEQREFEVEESLTGKPKLNKLKDFINYQGEIIFRKINGDLKATPQLDADPLVKGGLEGAKFVLLPSEAYASLSKYSDKYLEEHTHIADENGVVHITGLKPGKYILKEIEAPTDFITRTKEYEFDIQSEHQGNPGNSYQEQYKQVTFANYKGTAELIKTDNEGNSLAGAVFNIVDAQGTIIQKNLLSDSEGKVFAADLVPGTYFFKEVKAPTGFVINETLVEFTIDSQSESGRFDVTGLTLKNYQGSAQLIKRDEGGEGLAGAIFKVTNEAGEDVQTDLKSSETGEVVVENLAPGTYFFEETQAPIGYVLNQEKVAFVIADKATEAPEIVTTNQAGELSLTNYQGSATLTKVDHKNPLKKLANATFDFVASNGDIIKEQLVTDEAGQINVTDLAPGVYYFVETAAPIGYDLDETPVKVEIEAAATGKPVMVMVTKVNQLTPVELTPPSKPKRPYIGTPVKSSLPAKKQDLPQAGSQRDFTLVALGTGLISLVIFAKRRKAAKI